MGFVDWLKGAAKTVGRGIDWIHQNITTPILNTASKIPVISNVVQAAKPITDLAGKVGGALQGKGGISADDVGNAVQAVPGTVLAAKGAAVGGLGGLAKRIALGG